MQICERPTADCSCVIVHAETVTMRVGGPGSVIEVVHQSWTYWPSTAWTGNAAGHGLEPVEYEYRTLQTATFVAALAAYETDRWLLNVSVFRRLSPVQVASAVTIKLTTTRNTSARISELPDSSH